MYTRTRETAEMLSCAVSKNGRIIKTGMVELKDDRAEETFALKMIQKYTANDMDAVDVWFR